MKLTQQEYNELIRKHPNLVSQPRISSGVDTHSRLCATKQEQPKRKSLERTAQRKDKSCTRFEIRFTICAIRGLDWDNPWTKAMQDMLVHAGILHDDAWNVLRGCVDPQKVHKKEEEKMIITINPI